MNSRIPETLSVSALFTSTAATIGNRLLNCSCFSNLTRRGNNLTNWTI